MIHRRTGRKLKRTASHRKALLSNLSVSLIKNKKIITTLAKAKELRRYIEPLITKSRSALRSKNNNKNESIHSRRIVNKFLKDQSAVKMLFDEIAPKVLDRNGGYTRVLKIGKRLGDASELAIIELVDYNLEQTEQKTKEKQSSETAAKTTALKKASKTTRKSKKKELTADKK